MKKFLFSLFALGIWSSYIGQIIFNVNTPSAIAGYQPTSLGVAQQTGGWTIIPDLTDPANSVTGQLVLVDDGSVNPTLGCNALINGGDVIGKIALIDRGACNFGLKALNAQDEGAIAVVIINNIPGGGTTNPGGSAESATIDIPVVMIPYEAGQDILPYLSTGVEVFIGSLPPVDNDLFMKYGFAAIQDGTNNPKGPYYQTPISQIQPLTFYGNVNNNGLLNQTGVTVNTTISSVGFSTSSTAEPLLAPSNSVLLSSLATFTPTPSVNAYTVLFESAGNETDENNFNNTKSATYHITDYIYALDSGSITGGWFGNGYAYKCVNAFDIFTTTELSSIDVIIRNSSVAGAQLRGILYQESGGVINQIAVTPYYTLTSSDVANQAIVNLTFINAITLTAGVRYFAGFETPGNNGNNYDVVVSTSGINYNEMSFNVSEQNELLAMPVTPMIRMNFTPCNGGSTISWTMYDMGGGNNVACNCNGTVNLSVENNSFVSLYNQGTETVDQSIDVSNLNTVQITNICPGFYTLFGYDECGTKNDSIALTIYTSDFTASAVGIEASSCTATDGAVWVTLNCPMCFNGIDHSISWTGPSNGSTAIIASGSANTTINNLPAGDYTFQINSLNNPTCTPLLLDVTIGEPGLQATMQANNASDCATPNGTIVVDYSASSGSHIISWSGPTNGNTTLPSGNGSYTISNLMTGNYSINIEDLVNSNCTSFDGNIFVGADLVTQDICVVTVDETTSNHNIIFWEKPANMDAIDSFYVYREITLNNYQIIGALGADELSLFEDFGANPNASSYKYKITALDTCGNEGPLSIYHKSIHLQYLGLGNFQWTQYEIENTPNQVASYNIYRDDNATGNWQILPNGVIPGSQQTYTDVMYASFPNALYRVDVNWLNGNECTATRANINTSRSNTKGTVAAPVDAIYETFEQLINVYPNPATDWVAVNLPAVLVGKTYTLTNSMGQVMQKNTLTSTQVDINMGDLANGIYYLQVETTVGSVTKKIVKQ
jgi:hypothetical protein